LPFLPIEPIPDAPPYIRGAIILRGTAIPVVDTTVWLNLKRTSTDPLDPHLILLSIQDHAIAFIVDEVIDLVPLPHSLEGPSQEALIKIQLQDNVIEESGTLYRFMNPEQSFKQEDLSVIKQIQ
jgi:chemotaxis signal transduction protein